MISVIFGAWAALMIPDVDLANGAPTLHHIKDAPAFLQAGQVRTLLVGATISHRPPGARGTAHMTFKANGTIDIINPKGRRSKGHWTVKNNGVLCLENIGGGGTKSFCAFVTRKGNRVYHYHPKTHERINAAPWAVK
jgi:hypothetical protein